MNNIQPDLLKACLYLSALRQSGQIRRSFWINALKSPADLVKLADQRGYSLIKHVGDEQKIKKLQDVIGDEAFHLNIERQLDVARSSGISACSWLDDAYPQRLLHISSFPLVLYQRGRLEAEDWQGSWLTVVGTRRPSVYGRMVTRKIIGELAGQGWITVSGLARGIDGEAHRSALNGGGKSVAVLANGLDIAYPAEHAKLMEQLAEHGLLLSEYPPGTVPRKQHFPARNRILSGLSQVTAVIEANVRSGSLITAGFAADQGREVFAVPGNIYSGNSRGCNLLIRDGAHLLLSAEDLFEFRQYPEKLIQAADVSLRRTLDIQSAEADRVMPEQLTASENSPFNPEEIKIISALSGCALTLDHLALACEQPVSRLSVILTKLELSGQIIYEKGHYALTDPSVICI